MAWRDHLSNALITHAIFVAFNVLLVITNLLAPSYVLAPKLEIVDNYAEVGAQRVDLGQTRIIDVGKLVEASYGISNFGKTASGVGYDYFGFGGYDGNYLNSLYSQTRSRNRPANNHQGALDCLEEIIASRTLQPICREQILKFVEILSDDQRNVNSLKNRMSNASSDSKISRDELELLLPIFSSLSKPSRRLVLAQAQQKTAHSSDKIELAELFNLVDKQDFELDGQVSITAFESALDIAIEVIATTINLGEVIEVARPGTIDLETLFVKSVISNFGPADGVVFTDALLKIVDLQIDLVISDSAYRGGFFADGTNVRDAWDQTNRGTPKIIPSNSVAEINFFLDKGKLTRQQESGLRDLAETKQPIRATLEINTNLGLISKEVILPSSAQFY